MTIIITGPGDYLTRNGKKAKVIGHIPRETEHMWVGYLDGRTDVEQWKHNGSVGGRLGHPLDIIRPWIDSKYYAGWVNIYPDLIESFDTKENAEANFRLTDLIGCRRVRFKVGGKLEDITGD